MKKKIRKRFERLERRVVELEAREIARRATEPTLAQLVGDPTTAPAD